LFEEAFGPLGFAAEEDLGMSGWYPSCDVYETENELILKMELPEVKKEDIKVQVDGNVLTIRGERKLEKEVKKEDYHRLERSYGEFVRSFTLPPTTDPNTLTAESKDGVLRIAIKRREEAKAKTIDVKVK
jgi:HSP20 family protein